MRNIGYTTPSEDYIVIHYKHLELFEVDLYEGNLVKSLALVPSGLEEHF